MDTIELLAEAAFEGRLDEMVRLLDAGADIDAEGRCWNPLHAAIENEQVSCVRLLIARGANLDRLAGGLTPLAHAVDSSIDANIQANGLQGNERVEIVQLLISAGADIEPGLVIARLYQNAKLVQLLNSQQRSP